MKTYFATLFSAGLLLNGLALRSDSTTASATAAVPPDDDVPGSASYGETMKWIQSNLPSWITTIGSFSNTVDSTVTFITSS